MIFKCVHSQFLKYLLVSETEATHFFLFPLPSSLDRLSTWVLYPVLEVKIPGVYHFSLATVVWVAACSFILSFWLSEQEVQVL